MQYVILRYLIIFLLLFGSCHSFAQTNAVANGLSDKEVIKVGLPIVPGFVAKDKAGKPVGFAVEVLQQALNDEQIDFEWIEGTWSDLFQMLLDGDIDVLPSVQITKERREIVDFLDFALHTMWSELFIDKKFLFNSINDLRNKRIGLIQNDNNARGFVEFIKDFNVDYVPVYFTGHTNALDALERGDIDAMAGPPAQFLNEYTKTIKSCGLVYNPTSVSVAFSKHGTTEIRSRLNKRFEVYMNDTESIYNTLYKKYNIDLNSERFVFPFILKVVLGILGIILIFGVIFIYLLKQQVTLKTAELIKAKNKAEESERLKSAFLANMSHEIRTPLNSILGFSEMLSAEDISPEEKKQFAGIILRQNNILLRLINDIIEISKIEAGSVEIKKNKIKRINPILSDTFDNFMALCPENIELKLDNQLPDYMTDLEIDIIRVKQILTNMLSNALKYSEKGTVVLGCGLTTKGQLQFWVKDEGKGIDKDDLLKVFDRFRQLDALSNGAGLGLAICKLLAELMDGEMGVESEIGKGSTFTLTLNSY